MGKIYQNENQILLQDLIVIYQPDNFDWLSYQITKKNILTLHHVEKIEYGGILDITNSALLTKRAHRALNMCEARDYYLYEEINDFFRKIIAHHAPLNDTLKAESVEYKKQLVKTLYY